MRSAGWWSILWSDRIVELPLDAPILRLGEEAIDALGRRAPRCTVSEWIYNFPIFKEKIPRWEWPELFERFQLINLPFEDFVAGGILRQLLQQVGPHNTKLSFPEKPPKMELLDRAIGKGLEEGLSAFAEQLKSEASLAMKLVEKNFRL